MLAIYCRVSSKMQSDGESLPEQEQAGIDFAKSIGSDYRVYREVESAKNISGREALTALITHIEANQIDGLWIGDIDRLTRDVEDGGRLFKILQSKNVELYNRGQKISSLEFHLRVVLATEGRSTIIKNTTRNRRSQIDAGDNRYSSIYGYRQNVIGSGKNGKAIREWVLDDTGIQIVKMVYDLHEQNKNFDQICRDLHDAGFKPLRGKNFDRGTIHIILRRPEYTGRTFDTKGNLIPSKIYKHVIIPVERWEQIQATIDGKIRIRQGKHFRPAGYACSGIVKCAHCQAPYFFHRGLNRRGEVREKYYHKQITNDQRACNQKPKYVDRDTLDQLFSALYIMTYSDYERIEKFIEAEQTAILRDNDALANDILRINNNIDTLQKQIKRLIEAVKTGALEATDIKDDVSNLKNQIAEQEKILTVAKDKLDLKTKDLSSLISDIAKDNVSSYLYADATKRRELNIKYAKSATIKDNILTVDYISGANYVINLHSIPINIIDMMVLIKMATDQDKLSVITAWAQLQRDKDSRRGKNEAVKLLQGGNIDYTDYDRLFDKYISIKRVGRPKKIP